MLHQRTVRWKLLQSAMDSGRHTNCMYVLWWFIQCWDYLVRHSTVSVVFLTMEYHLHVWGLQHTAVQDTSAVICMRSHHCIPSLQLTSLINIWFVLLAVFFPAKYSCLLKVTWNKEQNDDKWWSHKTFTTQLCQGFPTTAVNGVCLIKSVPVLSVRPTLAIVVPDGPVIAFGVLSFSQRCIYLRCSPWAAISSVASW